MFYALQFFSYRLFHQVRVGNRSRMVLSTDFNLYSYRSDTNNEFSEIKTDTVTYSVEAENGVIKTPPDISYRCDANYKIVHCKAVATQGK